MNGYVDGYVLPVQAKKMAAYKKMAAEAGKIWMKHGAVRYVECTSDDLKSAEKWGGLSFSKLANAGRTDKVIFAFVMYKSKAHRNKVNAKVMKDPIMTDPKYKDKRLPFEMKRMAYGGFDTIVDYNE
jgi:uncharacterized protein YbaA (DUF1428 family)